MYMNRVLFKCTSLPGFPKRQRVNYTKTGTPFSSAFLVFTIPAAVKHVGVTTAAGQADHSTVSTSVVKLKI